MDVILIGFFSFVFVIGVYEVIIGKTPGNQMKWYFGLNTPKKIRIAASISILISSLYISSHKPISTIQYILLVFGIVCG
jgi:hypothetical protein